MIYKFIFDPIALEEYADAIHWYKDKSENVAEQLVSEIEKRIEFICSDPYRYRNTHKYFRETSLLTFPYYIVYFINEQEKIIIISSLYHHKRNPKKKYKK